MGTNRDLLKEAIADAKAVKETAIANAKAALEEAFTPFLKEKLASKIAEIDEEEMNEVKVEDENMNEVEMEEENMDEISLDELLAELEEEESAKVDETKAEDESMYEAKEEEEMNIEDMTEDDLKAFIEDVIKDMVEAGELEAGESTEEESGEEGGEELEIDMEAGAEEVDEEINIDELLAEEEVEEISPASSAGAEVSGNNEAIQAIAKALDKSVDWVKAHWGEIKKASQNIGKAAMASKGRAYEAELEEAFTTIKELKNELNEINLLNAKLLYTNKIFRNKSLTETQKVHVLTSFDKAETKKEVELVYETLIESLKTSTKSPIKESLGSASKALGTAKSSPIIENDVFSRMRELAFGNNKK